MKKILAPLMVLMTLVSCVEDGPKGNVYIPERTTDEIVCQVLDAIDGHSWYYEYDVELHCQDGGNWYNAGRYSVYKSFSQFAKGDNKWVDFGDEEFLFPAEEVDYAGYSWCVTRHGKKYYW